MRAAPTASKTPAGNITDTVYDALGRVTSILVGTNDTPGSSNMVDVQDNVYDNGGVGDGDLTQTTLHPGDGQPDRVTQYAYDWEDRQIAAQSGNYGSNTGPISYQVLDNLGEVVEQETFAGDGVTLAELGATDGVPNPPSSDALWPRPRPSMMIRVGRTRRPWRSSTKPRAQIMSTQTTDDWYDGRGHADRDSLARRAGHEEPVRRGGPAGRCRPKRTAAGARPTPLPGA